MQPLQLGMCLAAMANSRLPVWTGWRSPARIVAVFMLGCACSGNDGDDDPSAKGTSTQTGTDAATAASSMTTAGPDNQTDNTGGPTMAGPASTGPMSTGSASTGSETGIGADCDPWVQDCPEGFKCAPDLSQEGFITRSHCVPLSGNPGQLGDPCTPGDVPGGDTCDIYAFCENADRTEPGTCGELCRGSPEAPICSAGHVCLPLGAINLCRERCNPLIQDCAEGQGCYQVIGLDFVCVDTVGGYGPGEPCGGGVNACSPGLACVASSSVLKCPDTHCCTEFCPLNESDFSCADAGSGAECVPWFSQDEAPPGLEAVGVCSLP